MHDATCQAVERMRGGETSPPRTSAKAARRRATSAGAAFASAMVEELIHRLLDHRSAGQAALIEGNANRALAELWAARDLEVQVESLGLVALRLLPPGADLETDLLPLARVLSSRSHPRAREVWRRLLEDAPARSVQTEAGEWLARDAFGRGTRRTALRMLHACSMLGWPVNAEGFRFAYGEASLDPGAQFGLYLVATRLDAHAARAHGLVDPLTGQGWPDQDPRWWLEPDQAVLWPRPSRAALPQASDHRQEAFSRARDLAVSSRDLGWLSLAEGDLLIGPSGPRPLARAIRTGAGDQVDQNLFVRARLAYEHAADRLPEVAWPWYRLAELVAWAGFGDRARAHLAEADRRALGSHALDRAVRRPLQDLVRIALGELALPTTAEIWPFPTEAFGRTLASRFRLPFGRR